MAGQDAQQREDALLQIPPSNIALPIPVASITSLDLGPFPTDKVGVETPMSFDGVAMSADDEASEKSSSQDCPLVTSRRMHSPEIPPRRSTIPRANCTHTVMDIQHTDAPCDFCGRSSRLGWLYLCQQDFHRESSMREQLRFVKALVITDDMTVDEEVGAVGMSDSVIEQVNRGVYTPEQLGQLMEQKLNLQKVITAQLDLEREPWNTHTASPSESDKFRCISVGYDTTASKSDIESAKESIRPNITARAAARKESLTIMLKTGNARGKSPSMSRCVAKACQICRPYFKDRTYMSLASTFIDNTGTLSADRFIPVRDVTIVRSLGLRPPILIHPAFQPGPSSAGDTSSTESSSSIASSGSFLSEDEIRSSGALLPQYLPDQISHPSTPIDDGTDQAGRKASIPLNDALHAHMIGAGQYVNISPQRESAPPSTSLKADLHRTISRDSDQSDLGTQKSNLLSRGSTDILSATPATVSPALVGPSNPRGSAASSIASDEVAVDGGVALTEEAVENEVPDIITDEPVGLNVLV